MRKKLILLAIVMAFINNGCSIEDDDANVDVELPESFDYNETYEILVNYIKPDSCTNYEGFDVVKDSLTVRNVVAIGSVRTDTDNCTVESIVQTASFYFKVIYTDSYTFKFYTGENSEGGAQYLEVVVPVNKP